MTSNQQKFADEYLLDSNATRAYLAAYPHITKDTTARSNGARLLVNADIKDYIETRLEEMSSAKIAEATEVMQYLSSVMRGESRSSVLRFVGDGAQELLDKPPDEKERLKAAEMLSKRYGLLTDKLDVSGGGVVVITGGEALED